MSSKDIGWNIIRNACMFWSFLCHLVALAKCQRTEELDRWLQFDWRTQFILVACLLCVLSVGCRWLSGKGSGILLLFVRIVFSFLFIYPVGNNILIVFILCTAMILESFVYVNPPFDFCFAIASILFPFVSLLPHRRLDPNIPLPSVTDIIIMLVCLISFAFSVALAKREWMQRLKLSQNLQLLQDNVFTLTLANLEYQKKATQIEEEATESERLRITREIHDMVGYALTNVAMVMEAALRLLSPEQKDLRELLVLTMKQAREGLRDTRSALYKLRQQDAQKLHGIRAVHRLTILFQEITGIQVVIDFGNVPLELDRQVEDFLFRFVQEGLVNAYKHGNPTEIRIYFYRNGETLNVSLRDNGVGCASIKEGIGVQGIRERLHGLNGQLNIKSDRYGFSLTANIPITAAEWTVTGMGLK